MRHGGLQLCIIASVIFIVALAVRMPAGWAIHWLRDRIPVELDWKEVRGSLFDARLYGLTLDLPDRSPVNLDMVEMRSSLSGLLTGSFLFDYRVTGYDGEAAGRVRIGISGWQMSGVDIRMPMARLDTVFPQIGTAGLDGTLLINGDDLGAVYGGAATVGNLVITIEQLQTGLVRLSRPLGDYQITLEGQGDSGIHGQMRTLSSQPLLHIEGDVRLEPGKKILSIKGRARAVDEAPPAVEAILPALGTVRGDTADIDWRSGFSFSL